MSKKILIPIAVVFLFIFIVKTYFVDKVVGQEIVLGQSTALSGPSEKLGYEFTNGAKAYFNYVNEKGGIHNRTIKLKTLDDSYEPKYAVQNTLKLIKEDKVFALFGEVGTPTSKAVLPLVNQYNIPYLMPFTGADFLRSKSQKMIINLRTSYENEIKALIQYLTQTYNTKRFAVFYQNDSYGKVGYAAVNKTLTEYDLKIVAEGRYRRNTLAYRNALQNIKNANPEAIIIIGTYKTIASFIKDAKKMGMNNTKFCNISFVAGSLLMEKLGEQTNNVLVSQVVPSAWDSNNKAVKEYQEIFSKYYPKEHFSFISLEGFLAAKLVVKAIEKSGVSLTRKTLLEAFKKLDKNSLEGLTLSLSNKSNEALKKVYITDFHQNQFRTLKEVTIHD